SSVTPWTYVTSAAARTFAARSSAAARCGDVTDASATTLERTTTCVRSSGERRGLNRRPDRRPMDSLLLGAQRDPEIVPRVLRHRLRRKRPAMMCRFSTRPLGPNVDHPAVRCRAELPTPARHLRLVSLDRLEISSLSR